MWEHREGKKKITFVNSCRDIMSWRPATNVFENKDRPSRGHYSGADAQCDFNKNIYKNRLLRQLFILLKRNLFTLNEKMAKNEKITIVKQPRTINIHHPYILLRKRAFF